MVSTNCGSGKIKVHVWSLSRGSWYNQKWINIHVKENSRIPTRNKEMECDEKPGLSVLGPPPWTMLLHPTIVQQKSTQFHKVFFLISLTCICVFQCNIKMSYILSESGNVWFVNECKWKKVLRPLSWWPRQKACGVRIHGLVASLLSTSKTTEWPPPESSSRLSLISWPFIDREAAEEYTQYQQYCQKCDKNPLDNLPPNAWFRTCKMNRRNQAIIFSFRINLAK